MRLVLLTITAAATFIALVVNGLVSYRTPLVAAMVDGYGAAVANLAPLEVIHPGGLRDGILTAEHQKQLAEGKWTGLNWRELPQHEQKPGTLAVLAVTPDASDYAAIVSGCLEKRIKVVAESSGMDGWHTTAQGWVGLQNLTSEVLRVVVFDGGHHLPTLGLQPDLLIVPVTMGYIAHGHTRDAMRVEELLAILEREQIECPVVAVPRWGLVKTTASMNRIVIRALALVATGDARHFQEGEVLGSRCTRYRKASFLYVNYLQGTDWGWLESANTDHVERVYLAFNYDLVRREQAEEVIKKLKGSGLQVELANEPLHVAGIIIRGGMRCISARMPWY